MGRAHHLKETLPQNIRDNQVEEGLDIEFVVLNYNSQDDLHEWMTTDPKMSEHIRSGLVRYGHTADPDHFHMSHAKNMAHRMATGDVLCNLDADNFTGLDFARFLKANFEQDMDIVMNPSNRVSKLYEPDERGFFGRVVISRENFETLHGYDENFSGWGGEDTDFMQRAKGLGARHVRIDTSQYLSIIPHTNEERVHNMFDGEKRDQELAKVEDMKHGHQTKFVTLFNKMKVLAKPIQANPDGRYGMGNVTMANNEPLILGADGTNAMSPFNTCALGLPELLRGRISPRIAQNREKDYKWDDHKLSH